MTLNKIKTILLATLYFSFFIATTSAQPLKNDDFTPQTTIPSTPVKNQYRSSTCWSFAGLSFIESELLRTQKEEYDLSEMFIVKQTYIKKAQKYVRLHGHLNFTSGGEFNDVFDIIKSHGIVPETAYDGKKNGEALHNHGEMDEILKNYVDAIVKNKNNKLTPMWSEAFEMVLNTYLGAVPNKFEYKNKSFTPETFLKSLNINFDDYIYITSFAHQPYYTKFILEVPDNWSWGSYYNLPIEDLEKVVDNSLKNGYSIGWAGDITESGFSWDQGIAKINTTDDITAVTRQTAFDNYETTDDHGMHIIGVATDKNNDPFYIVKNSWGTNNTYDGYLYMSKPYLRYKTVSIVLNKSAIPIDIAKKMGLKL